MIIYKYINILSIKFYLWLFAYFQLSKSILNKFGPTHFFSLSPFGINVDLGKIIVNNSNYFQLPANNSIFWKFFNNTTFTFSLLPMDPSKKWLVISSYLSSSFFFIIIQSLFHYLLIIPPLNFLIIQPLFSFCCQWTI